MGSRFRVLGCVLRVYDSRVHLELKDDSPAVFGLALRLRNLHPGFEI